MKKKNKLLGARQRTTAPRSLKRMSQADLPATVGIVKEMRGENRIALDAIKNVIEKQYRQEFETAALRKTFHSLYRT